MRENFYNDFIYLCPFTLRGLQDEDEIKRARRWPEGQAFNTSKQTYKLPKSISIFLVLHVDQILGGLDWIFFLFSKVQQISSVCIEEKHLLGSRY